MKSRLVFYILLFTLSLAVGHIFKPYPYIDNEKSQIVCLKNNQSFEAGWNFIYTFEDTLDNFNDKKARKLCEYNIIKDYADTVQVPKEVNYRFEPKYIQESSWVDAIFMASATLILGIIFIEFFKVKIPTYTNLLRPHQITKSILVTISVTGCST